MASSFYETIQFILKKLFEAEDRRVKSLILQLNTSNEEIQKENFFGFIFNGEHFVPEGMGMLNSMTKGYKPQLAPQLIKLATQMVADKSALDFERKRMGQILHKLLGPCTTLQSIRDALPECLVNLVPELSKIPRCDPDGWTLRNDPRGLAQYQKMLPVMEAYSVSGMFY